MSSWLFCFSVEVKYYCVVKILWSPCGTERPWDLERFYVTSLIELIGVSVLKPGFFLGDLEMPVSQSARISLLLCVWEFLIGAIAFCVDRRSFLLQK
jgi:hypothetical protein